MWLLKKIDKSAAGVQGVADVPLYGRIATMELFRPPARSLARTGPLLHDCLPLHTVPGAGRSD